MTIEGSPFQPIDYVRVVKRGSLFKGKKGIITMMTFHPLRIEVYFDKPSDEIERWEFLPKDLKLVKQTWWRRWWWKRWPPRFYRERMVKNA